MKLSEAIRLGALTGPQCFELICLDDATCAIGSAFKAIGKLNVLSFTYQQFRVEFPIVLIVDQQPCPACGDELHLSFGHSLIPHLNDTHRWTRERIADWVEGIERAQEAKIETGSVPSLEPAVEFGALAQKS